MKETVTDRILKIMEDNELTQSRFGHIIGIARNNISEWKKGKTKPSPKILINIIENFPEVDANWLIRGTEYKSQQNQKAKTGDYGNIQQAHGNKNKIVNDSNHDYGNSAEYQKEIKYLKTIIETKNEQIDLLKKLMK